MASGAEAGPGPAEGRSQAGTAVSESRKKSAREHFADGLIAYQKGGHGDARKNWILARGLDPGNEDAAQYLTLLESEFGKVSGPCPFATVGKSGAACLQECPGGMRPVPTDWPLSGSSVCVPETLECINVPTNSVFQPWECISLCPAGRHPVRMDTTKFDTEARIAFPRNQDFLCDDNFDASTSIEHARLQQLAIDLSKESEGPARGQVLPAHARLVEPTAAEADHRGRQAETRRLLLEADRERAQNRRREQRQMILTVSAVVGVLIIAVGAVAGTRLRKGPDGEEEADHSAKAPRALFKLLSGEELLAKSLAPRGADVVVQGYLKAGRGRDLSEALSKLPEETRAVYAMAFLRSGDYDAAWDLLRRGHPKGRDLQVHDALRRVVSRRRGGALSSEFVAYGERLELGLALSQLRLGAEASAVLGEMVVASAWKTEADAYIVAKVYGNAELSGEFSRSALEDRAPGFYSGYAQAFLLQGDAPAGLALLSKKARLEGEDWGLLVGLHAKNGSLDSLDPGELPEGERGLLAEALIESGKEAAAWSVLERVSRPRWGAREFGLGLRVLQRQDRFEEARGLYQEAEGRLPAQSAPELRYYWALFCERRGEFARARATYKNILQATQGYKDADVRLKNLDAIPPEELSRLSTVCSIRDTRTAVGSLAPETEPPATALVAARYEILRPLGVGGMGVVYKARDRSELRAVALKRMRRRVAQDRRLKDLFQEEARTLSELHHPGIVAFYRSVESEGDLYLVFEFVDGETLSELLACRGVFKPSECARVLGRAAAALAHAHEQGVAHLDVKPANLMLDRQGLVKVMDFGIARHCGEAGGPESGGVGTPAYMAPEQHTGAPDSRADLYALGATAYELLTGRLPFPFSEGLAELKRREAYAPLPEGLPRVLKDLVARCLKADPAQRPRSMAAVSAELV